VCNLFSEVAHSEIPGEYSFDSRTIVQLFKHFLPHPTAFYIGPGQQGKRTIKLKAWGTVFRLRHRSFAGKSHKLRFNGFMKTDGIRCSIIFTNKFQHTHRPQNYHPNPTSSNRGKYLSALSIQERAAYRNRNPIAFDPGVRDMVHGRSPGGKMVRYTSEQRKVESCVKMLKKKQDNLSSNIVGVTTIRQQQLHFKEQLRQGGNCSSASLTVTSYRAYLDCSIILRGPLYIDHYRRKVHRRLRLTAYGYKRRSEAGFIKRVRLCVGVPDEAIIFMGNWGSGGRQQSGHAPHLLNSGITNILQQAGYVVYLINEYRTSKRCHTCGTREVPQIGTCVNFRKVHNPRLRWRGKGWGPYRYKGRGQKSFVKAWGLTKCDLCGKLWNRDTNGAQNILLLGQALLRGEDRPGFLGFGNE
jgi:hypothetical protein